MPLLRGRAPTSRQMLAPSKACVGIVMDVDPGQQRKRAVVELHRRSLRRLHGVGNLEQAQMNRRVRSEHLAAAILKRRA